jgi:hypothetical protein
MAMLIGIINLFGVHWRKVRLLGQHSLYSLALLLSMVITAGIIYWTNLHSTAAIWIFSNVLLPAESSLMAMLAIVLIFAAMRFLIRSKNLFSGVFLVTVLLILFSAIPFTTKIIPLIHDKLAGWIITIPAVAGARGILLGMALGILATGIRVLIGNHRPYDG